MRRTKHNKVFTDNFRAIGEVVKLSAKGNEWVVVHTEGDIYFLVPLEIASLDSWEHFKTLPLTATAKASMLMNA